MDNTKSSASSWASDQDLDGSPESSGSPEVEKKPNFGPFYIASILMRKDLDIFKFQYQVPQGLP